MKKRGLHGRIVAEPKEHGTGQFAAWLQPWKPSTTPEISATMMLWFVGPQVDVTFTSQVWKSAGLRAFGVLKATGRG